MRLLNDRQKTEEHEAIGLFSLPFYSLLCAFGIATVILSPLTMILAHQRLPGFWPKLTAVLGAVGALLLLDVPVALTVLGFVYGNFVADAVDREVPVWHALSQAVTLAAVLGVVSLAVAAPLQGVSMAVYWTTLVDQTLLGLKESVVASGLEWEAIRGLLLYEGPFLYLSGAVVSFWLSVGFASHMGWFKEGHRYSGRALREVLLPRWSTVVFAVLFVLTFKGESQEIQRIAGGLFRLLSVVMFLQGTVYLSRAMSAKSISRNVRTVVYSVSVFLGFYAVVILGVLCPWVVKSPAGQVPLNLKKLEEVL